MSKNGRAALVAGNAKEFFNILGIVVFKTIIFYVPIAILMIVVGAFMGKVQLDIFERIDKLW